MPAKQKKSSHSGVHGSSSSRKSKGGGSTAQEVKALSQGPSVNAAFKQPRMSIELKRISDNQSKLIVRNCPLALLMTTGFIAGSSDTPKYLTSNIALSANGNDYYYSLPLNPAVTTMPVPLVNHAQVFSKYNIEAARLRYEPFVGTGALEDFAATKSFNPGQIAVALTAPNDQQYGSKATASAASAIGTSYLTVAAAGCSMVGPPGLPMATNWWRRAPSDHTAYPSLGRYALTNATSSLDPSSGVDASFSAPIAVVAAYDSGGVTLTAAASPSANLGSFFLDADFNLMYPRGDGWTGAQAFALVDKMIDACACCHLSKSPCVFCGNPAFWKDRDCAMQKLSAGLKALVGPSKEDEKGQSAAVYTAPVSNTGSAGGPALAAIPKGYIVVEQADVLPKLKLK